MILASLSICLSVFCPRASHPINMTYRWTDKRTETRMIGKGTGDTHGWMSGGSNERTNGDTDGRTN